MKRKPKTSWEGWMVFQDNYPLMWAAGETRRKAVAAFWWVLDAKIKDDQLPGIYDLRRVTINIKEAQQ